jgi:hypothetical protein
VTDLADGPVLAISGEKITASHRARDAYVYVRQSALLQVRANTESLARQYDLRQRAVLLGWPAHQVVVVDEDLGRSGASAAGRSGFSELVADVGLARPGSCWRWSARGWPARTRTGTSCWICAR